MFQDSPDNPFQGGRLKVRKNVMLIVSLIVIVIWVFTLALCRAAGDADRYYEEEMERRRREEAAEG